MADPPPTIETVGVATGLTPRLRRLALFLLLNFALVNGVLLLAGVPLRQTTLQSASWFLTGRQGGDSWRPMGRAYHFLVPEQQRSRTLYEKLFFSPAVEHKGFQYPPTSLLLVHALQAAFGGGWLEALRALNWLSVLGIAVAVALVFARALRLAGLVPPGGLGRPERVWIGVATALATLTFYPAIVAYRGGQASALLNALFAVGLWAWLSQRPGAAAVSVTAMMAVKPQHGFLCLWSLVRRHWRFAAVAVASSLAVLGASIGLFGFHPHWEYLGVIRFLARRGESFYPNQSANGLMNRLLSNGENLEFTDTFVPYHPVVYAVTVASSAVLLVLALLWRRPAPGRSGGLDFAAAGLAGTMASPIAWEHHYGLLLPIFALMLPLAWSGRVFRPSTAGLLAVLWVVAGNCLHVTTALADTPLNVVQSYLYAAALAVLWLLLTGRSREPARA